MTRKDSHGEGEQEVQEAEVHGRWEVARFQMAGHQSTAQRRQRELRTPSSLMRCWEVGGVQSPVP